MKVQEQPETSNTTTTKPRRGILSRFRRSKNGSSNQTADNREPPKVKSRSKSSKREGTPLEKRSSPQEMLPRSQRKPQSSTRVLDGPPAAENAAFSGPPRYDWIDIETSAAVKVQAAFRRLKVMNEMERNQLSTGPIRRRALHRLEEEEGKGSTYIYDCCGAGLLLEPELSPRELDRQRFEKKREERLAQEEKLRHDYVTMKMEKNAKPKVAEAYEVVE